MEDEYVVIATNSLWKYVTYEQVVHEVKTISDPIQAAKRLRDVAVSHGCHMDVSVIVVKLSMDRDPPIRSLVELQPLQEEEVAGMEIGERDIVSGLEIEEEEEEELGVTNIDDVLSEEEDGQEGDRIPALSLPMESATATQEDIDRMVLGAISSPQEMELHLQAEEDGREENSLMQSTNFDDLPPLSDGSPTPMGMDSTTSDLSTNEVTSHQQRYRQHLQQQQQQQLRQMEVDYEVQTLPKIASQSRKSSGLTPLETSFEQTQVRTVCIYVCVCVLVSGGT